jgi:hypothetical protein
LPQRRWLESYAEVFDTVEVNATVYRLPQRSTVESCNDWKSYALSGQRQAKRSSVLRSGSPATAAG